MTLEDKLISLIHIGEVCLETHNLVYDKIREYYKLEEREMKLKYIQAQAEYLKKQDKDYLTKLREKGF